MSDIKHVNVVLTQQDEKSFSRDSKGTTRRRKTPQKDVSAKLEKEELEAVVETTSALPNPKNSIPPQPPVQPKTLVPTPVQPKPLVPTPVQPKPLVSTPTPVSSVSIQAKKNTTLSKILPPKIIPIKKRISSVPPAVTLKKEKLIIAPQNTVQTAGKSENPGYPGDKRDDTIVPSTVDKKERKNTHTKKRYTERKISIEIQPLAQTKKHRRMTKQRIATMPIGLVNKILVKKGLLKPKHNSTMPEPIMRSMLHDYVLLHAIE